MKKTKPLLLSLFSVFVVLSPVLANEETSVPESFQSSTKVSYARQESKNQNNNLIENQNALEGMQLDQQGKGSANNESILSRSKGK